VKQRSSQQSPVPTTSTSSTALTRVIVGSQYKLRIGDGVWLDGGAPATVTQLLVFPTETASLGIKKVIQRWLGGQVIELIETDPLPNIDELNGRIDEREWEIDARNGQKREPYQDAYVLYLIHPPTAARATYVGSNTGGKIAVRLLRDCITSMQTLQGRNVTPVVELQTKPMPTKHGTTTIRPHFEPIKWWCWDKGDEHKALPPAGPQSGNPGAGEPSFSDSIPF
jgi:hypothetical protein